MARLEVGSRMLQDSAAGLPQFLRYLSARPHCAGIASALVRGPLSPLACTSAMLWVRDADGPLRLKSAHGIAEESLATWLTVPLTLSSPVTLAYHQSEVQVFEGNRRQDGAIHPATDLEALAALPRGSVDHVAVTAPIVLEGASAGVFACDARFVNGPSTMSIAALDGLSAALGLWLAAGPPGMTDPLIRHATIESASFDLTARQVRIAELIEDGKSNAGIAALLGYSLSTVKVEVQRIMRAMRAPDRASAAATARRLGLLTSRGDSAASA